MKQQMDDISDENLKGIFAMAKLAETRDSDMEKHLERVRTFSLLLTEKLGSRSRYQRQIDSRFTNNIFRASPLHDIGKAAIPDHILVKPGRLTQQEFTIIQTHADHGARTLETIKKQYPESAVLSMGIEISRYHHEKWDGSGYPHGLQRNAIPLAARILAVADVYDALSFTRCYKPAYTHEYSCEIIMQSSGSHFDPDVVDAFVDVNDKFRESREQMD